MSAQAKFCGSCGAELPPGVRFCTACGHPVATPIPPTGPATPAPVRPAPFAPPPAPPQPGYPPYPPYQQPGVVTEWIGQPPAGTARRPRVVAWIVAGLALVLVVGGGVVAWSVLRGDTGVVGTLGFDGHAVLAEPVTDEPGRDWSWSPAGSDLLVGAKVVGDRVLASTGSEVTALDENGEEQWTVDVDGQGYVIGAPDGHPDTVLAVGEEAGVVALSMEDGEELWSDHGSPIWTAEEGVYVVGVDGDLSLLDAESGEEQWTVSSADGFGMGEAGVFVVVGGELRKLGDDGSQEWSVETDAAGWDYASVTVADDFVVVSGSGDATAYDADDGGELWSFAEGEDGTTAGRFAGNQVFVYADDYSAEEATVEVSVRDHDGETGSLEADSTYFYATAFESDGDSYAYDYGSGRLYDATAVSVGTYQGSITPLDGGLYSLEDGELSYYELGASSPAWTLPDHLGDDAGVDAGDHWIVVLSDGEITSYS